MKNLFVLFLVLAFCLGFAACAAPAAENGLETKIEGDLSDIFDKIFDGADIPFIEKMPVSDDNMEYMIGTKDVMYTEGLACEAAFMSVPFSVVLLRLPKDTDDIDAVKALIRDQVDSFKWICVGVDKEKVIVDNVGDLLILIVSNSDAEKIHQNFLGLSL